jgi:hypothetical protein
MYNYCTTTVLEYSDVPAFTIIMSCGFVFPWLPGTVQTSTVLFLASSITDPQAVDINAGLAGGYVSWNCRVCMYEYATNTSTYCS